MVAQRKNMVEQTVNKERNRLFNFIRKRVSNPDDAEDILQDVFYQLWQGFDTIDNLDKITSWMFRVARNKIIDRYRKLKPDSFSEVESARADDAAPMLLSELISEEHATPDDVYTRELIWDSIETVLEELPKDQREVFIWHELEDVSFKEMSVLTGDSINTLLSRKRYAVKYLRKRLQELYNEI